MLDAYEGQLQLFRLDCEGEVTIGLSDTCTRYDVDALAYMLTWGGVSVEDAIEQAEEFMQWWNDSDIVEMLERGRTMSCAMC